MGPVRGGLLFFSVYDTYTNARGLHPVRPPADGARQRRAQTANLYATYKVENRTPLPQPVNPYATYKKGRG